MNKLIIQEIKSKDKKCPICYEQATNKVYCKFDGEKHKIYLCDSCLSNALREWVDKLFSEDLEEQK